MAEKNILDGLNSMQKKAVQYLDGPSVILAGAGSGKTRVLVYKVLNLIETETTDPKSIVMITFTNKAAGEMKERIFSNIGSRQKLGFVGTFHSFCAMMLRRDGEQIGIDRNFTIYDDGDQIQLFKELLKKQPTKYSPRMYQKRISDAKNQLISPEAFLDTYSYYQSAKTAEIYHQYQKTLTKNNALDFDDLLFQAVSLFRKSPETRTKYHYLYQYFLVDEFQDTNTAQYVLSKLLAEKSKNITVVGDFAQSIYSWRGAEIGNLTKFSKDFEGAKMFNLETNYRSTQEILDFAYQIISENQTHPILKLKTDKQAGEEVTIQELENEEAEASYIASQVKYYEDEADFKNMAILYRTNAQSRIIEEVFLHYAIPYKLVGGTRFYERKEIKDVLSYLRLFVNPTDSVALTRVKKIGKRRFTLFKQMYEKNKKAFEKKESSEIIDMIFKVTGYLEMYNQDDPDDYSRLENIKELISVALAFPKLVEFLEQVSLVESEYFEGEKKGNDDNGVRLMTLHQAKGLEFDIVFITGLEEGLLPHSRSVDDLPKLEEERRLFYVGITRAKRKLIITHAKKRFIFGRSNFSMKSRFIGSDEDVGSQWW